MKFSIKIKYVVGWRKIASPYACIFIGSDVLAKNLPCRKIFTFYNV